MNTDYEYDTSCTSWVLCLRCQNPWYWRYEVGVLSGTEVSTHYTTSVQKTKRFSAQIKNVGKIIFMKNQQFLYFSKGKLLCTKIHLPFSKEKHIESDFQLRLGNSQWTLGALVQNNRFHQALPLHLFGVRSQPRYLKLSTPRVLSTAQVNSRVVRLWTTIFLGCSERDSQNFRFWHEYFWAPPPLPFGDLGAQNLRFRGQNHKFWKHSVFFHNGEITKNTTVLTSISPPTSSHIAIFDISDIELSSTVPCRIHDKYSCGLVTQLLL